MCDRSGCPGEIDDDGYCTVCGLKASRTPAPPSTGPSAPSSGPAGGSTSGSTSAATTGTRSRSRLGAGLVEIPPVPALDPTTVVLDDPQVPESRRFCSACDEPVGRRRNGAPGRTSGFCRNCGTPFSFVPKLQPGDLVGGQYEVAGCLAHGGLGWIYLARDRRVELKWVVLKGLLNTNDEDAMAAALAEKRFLAQVEHPNIVRIHNFAEHDGDGYIVMEYVGGTSLRQLLQDRRAANGGQADPLPVAEAIAFVLDILPALGYLHDLGLAYCDFKPDNIIHGSHGVKLIDLGGVYRMDDRSSPIYGTVGYQAPEVSRTGPTVTSDLFTVGRTLAVLATEFRGYQSTFKHSLPERNSVPQYVRYDALYRFLERATAADPSARFQSTDEMAAQLLGILREVVAAETGRPSPGVSTLFTGNLRGSGNDQSWQSLPALLVASDDPAAGFLATVAAVDPDQVVEMLRAAPDRTVEVDLRIVRELLDASRLDEATDALARVEQEYPASWRTSWYRGLAALSSDQPSEALRHFGRVYRALPGEAAPKLAMARAAEASGDLALAAGLYDTVSHTDPSFTTASFGLARCRLGLHDQAGAVAAYDRVPPTSSVYVDAQVGKALALLGTGSQNGSTPDVAGAARVIDALPLDAERRAEMRARILESGLELVLGTTQTSGATDVVFGYELTERGMRLGLEASYRLLARQAPTASERVELVDRANRVRPRSLV